MAKTVAVIGASNDRHKYGNKAVRAFVRQGYTVYPINLHEQTVEGLPAYRSIADVPGPVDMASVYLHTRDAVRVLDDLARKGVPEVWLNPGADDDAVVERARALGLNVIQACSITGVGDSPGRY